MSADILVIDDEEDICGLIQGILEDEGYRTRSAGSATEAYAQVGEHLPDLVVLDIWLQGSDHDGLDILARLKDNHPLLPVVMISGHGTIETAVSAIKRGAYDFIEKPFKADRLLLLIHRALEAASLRKENQILRARGKEEAELLGDSAGISAIRQMIARVGATNSRVLITGEPGTGKDLAARLLHKCSARESGPFVSLNCAIMHPDRLEMELFGAEGAASPEGRKIGVLEQAHKGTLLLDEVADMPLETQGKIVRVLQEQRFTRVGGKDPVEVDVRIVASTNRNLEEIIEAGRFRQDLYYRLNVVPIEIIPLRERLQDVPVLAKSFMTRYSRQNGVPEREFMPNAVAAMQAYDWPGNVRQLRNVVEWVMIMHNAAEPVIRPEHLPPEILACGGENSGQQATDYLALPLRDARDLFEKEYLLSQISRFHGNISKTAQFIGMERSALHRKLKSLDISVLERHGSPGKDDRSAVPGRRRVG